mgnify:CR=1 FL=1
MASYHMTIKNLSSSRAPFPQLSVQFDEEQVSVIRKEFVTLTGDPFSAVILNQLLYWTLRVKDFDLYLEEEADSTSSEPQKSHHYGWIYKTFLPQGGKVLDTHLGSGSNRIAADKAGNIEFTAYEIDKDYFAAQEKRWKDYKSQLVMFKP